MTSPRPVPSRLAFLICSLASPTCPLRRLRVIGPSVRDFTSALRGWFSGGDAPWDRASRSGVRTPAVSLGGARLGWDPASPDRPAGPRSAGLFLLALVAAPTLPAAAPPATLALSP